MDTLSKAFDVEVIEAEVVEAQPMTLTTKPQNPSITNDSTEKALVADLEVSRQDLDTIIDLGKDALSNVLEIAEAGQHPRFYEAAALLIKSINEANRERMELHLKLSQIRKNQADIQKGPDITVERGLFVGTTQQLLDLVKPRKQLDVATE